jgi:predicted RNA binding protein YcfA (HicA-like mRNA interferase family)
MSKLRKISGYELIKLLCNKFGFMTKRQRGSHVLLVKVNNPEVVCVVPKHPELKIGLLKSILKQAKLSEEEFAQQS